MHRSFTKQVPGARTAILCLHGILASPAYFRPFLSFFPATASVHTLLFDGHGNAARDFSRSAMGKWEQQAEDEVRRLSALYDTIYIVAHSMGTLLAMDLASRHPKVRGLFLLATPLKIRVTFRALWESAKAYGALFHGEREKETAYGRACSVKLTKNPFAYLGWLPRFWELFRKSRAARQTICAVSVPTCIMQSQKDELVSLSSLRFVPQKPNFSVSVLPSARHFLYGEADTAILKDAFAAYFQKGDLSE